MPTKAESHSVFSLPTPADYVRQLLFSVLCWSGIVILESSQVFVSDATRGYVLPPAHYLAWAVFNWFVLALLTPLIYRCGRRFPLIGQYWWARLMFPHALFCGASVFAQAVGRGIAGWIYSTSHEQPAPPAFLAGEWLDKRGLLGVIAYWNIVIVATIAELREEVRRRELYQAQLEASLASAQLEKLRMQIQPHFLFNTMQAAITLVQESPEAAEDVLLRLSELLRISLDEMDEQEIPLARELEFLDLYIGIQKRRFGERVSFEIHADPATLNMAVPPLILQPLVENAVRYGIGKHKGQDSIDVFARRQNNGLQIEVWNANSVIEQTSDAAGRGVGLRNTRARLEHLYGKGASLELRPVARGGAIAMIFIPPIALSPKAPQTAALASP